MYLMYLWKCLIGIILVRLFFQKIQVRFYILGFMDAEAATGGVL